MLHTPQAQRRAARPRLPRTPRRKPELSVTLGDVRGGIMSCEEISPGHWLITIRDGSCYGQIAYAYAYCDAIPRWISERVYWVVGVISPAVDLTAYRDTRWWDDGWPVDPTAVLNLEELAGCKPGQLITPYHHDWLTPEQVADLKIAV